MAKVALIACNITQDPYPVYPLGMSMVAEAVRSHGHDVAENLAGVERVGKRIDHGNG